MKFTDSLDHETHAETGFTYHEDTKALPTVVSDQDMNMIIWELMTFLNKRGVAGKAFDADDPTTYQQVWSCIDSMITHGVGVGSICLFARTTAAPGFLKANGACVQIDVYDRLADAIYCGDAKNATALFGYRCSDVAGNVRAISGAYIKLPDLRGEFLRGWDDGRGVDIGRAFGTWQKPTLHIIDTGTSRALIGQSTGVDYATSINQKGYESINSSDYSGSNAVVNSQSGSTTILATDLNTDVEWMGAASRPRNIALLACIKY